MECDSQNSLYGSAPIPSPAQSAAGSNKVTDIEVDELFLYPYSVDASSGREKRRHCSRSAGRTVHSSPLSVALFKKCRVGPQSPSPPTLPILGSRKPCDPCVSDSTESSCVLFEDSQSGGSFEREWSPEVPAATKDECSPRSGCSSGSSTRGKAPSPGEEASSIYPVANQYLLQSHHERLLRRRSRDSAPGSTARQCQYAGATPRDGVHLVYNGKCMLTDAEDVCTAAPLGSVLGSQRGDQCSASPHRQERADGSILHSPSPFGTVVTAYRFSSQGARASELMMRKADEETANEFKQKYSESQRQEQAGWQPSSLYCSLNAFLRELQFS